MRTSPNSRVCASGARLAEHEVKSMKSNHEVDAPTSMDLSAPRSACPGLSDVALGPTYALRSMNVANPQMFSRHRLRLRENGRRITSCILLPPNGDIVEHRICEITRDSGYPPQPRKSSVRATAVDNTARTGNSNRKLAVRKDTK